MIVARLPTALGNFPLQGGLQQNPTDKLVGRCCSVLGLQCARLMTPAEIHSHFMAVNALLANPAEVAEAAAINTEEAGEQYDGCQVTVSSSVMLLTVECSTAGPTGLWQVWWASAKSVQKTLPLVMAQMWPEEMCSSLGGHLQRLQPRDLQSMQVVSLPFPEGPRGTIIVEVMVAGLGGSEWPCLTFGCA